MLKRKALAITLALASMIGLTGCLDGDNIFNYKAEGVVKKDVLDNIPGVVVCIEEGIMAVNDGALDDLEDGTFIWFEFELNYDEQPSKEYRTVTIKQYKIIKKLEFLYDREGEIRKDDYTAKLHGISLYLTPNYFGNALIYCQHYTTSDQEYEYRLIHNADSVDTTHDRYPVIHNLYLQSRALKEENASKTNQLRQTAFDFNSFINDTNIATRDTTINNADYKLADIYLNYQTDIDDEGNPVFKRYNSTPISLPLYIFD